MQAVLESALEQVLGQPHRVVGSGRTDTGAHAACLIASTVTHHPMEIRELARALDALLPPDVGIREAREVAPGFHARRDAAWKWYRYSLLRSPFRRPLLRRRTWHLRARLDAAILAEGAAALVGCHDFHAFANTGSPRRTTTRTIHVARWTEDDDPDLLHFDVVGDGFLYRMVRAIVGTLVHWARNPAHLEPLVPGTGPVIEPGPRAEAAIHELLRTGNHGAIGPVAPARGLCLMAVGVGDEPPPQRLPPYLHRAVESARRASPGGPP